MTAICPGSGPSQPIPGTASSVLLTGLVIASLLPAGLVWLEPFIFATAVLIDLNLPAFCVVDPPADPGLTALDVNNAILFPGLQIGVDAQRKIIQLIERFVWYQFCQCAPGPTPPPPAPPAAPPNLAAINPSPSTPGLNTPCTNQSQFVIPANSVFPAFPWTQGEFPFPPFPNAGPKALGQISFMQFDGFVDHTAGPGSTFVININTFQDQFGNFPVRTLYTTTVNNIGHTQTVLPINANERWWSITISNPSNTLSTDQCDIKINEWCNGQFPGSAAPPCCPPDDMVTGLLNQILTMTTLIQRQSAPFGYVEGTVHSGLSGNGSLSVSSLLGAKVIVTTLPARVGLDTGDPDTIFDVGWINFGTGANFQDRLFIRTSPQLFFPGDMGVVTSVGFSIPPDCAVSITELVREA